MNIPTDWSDPVIAIGTIILAIVTGLLALYTKNLSEITLKPNIVAVLSPSPRTSMYFDIHVHNEGTAAAFDIEIDFNPPIVSRHHPNRKGVPLRKISVLKAGQTMSSFMSGYEEIKDTEFSVNITWKRKPSSKKRDGIRYVIDTEMYQGYGTLGRDPIVEISSELGKISKSLEKITRGSRRLEVDIYSERERLREHRKLERIWRKEDKTNFDSSTEG